MNKKRFLLFLAALLVVLAVLFFSLSGNYLTGGVIFEENGGIVSIEVESSSLSGEWQEIDGLSGSSYVWDPQGSVEPPYPEGGQEGVMEYSFDVHEDGRYMMVINNKKYHDGHRDDLQNDVWTQMDDGPWVKTFSNGGHDWNWVTKFDEHPFHEGQPDAFYELSEGRHTLRVSGRSPGFVIDKVHIFREGYSGNQHDVTLPETTVEDSEEPENTEDPWPFPVEDSWTEGESFDVRKWHLFELEFNGPDTNERNNPNPFTDYKLNVEFNSPSGKVYSVPGFYAADGRSADSGSESGNIWKVRFRPDEVGDWSYDVSFRHGENIATISDANAGSPVSFDGASGEFSVGPTDKQGNDLRAKGRLDYVGEHYRRFMQTGEFFIKGGSGSPENFLGYYGFDGTWDQEDNVQKPGLVDGLHRYEAHSQHYNSDGPTWKNGKGKNILGVINYLSSKGVNDIYIEVSNIDGGDGGDTWPWLEPYDKSRFDVSKLEQWERVFEHMNNKGMMIHFILSSNENYQRFIHNNQLTEEGKLYVREMSARFGHNLAVTWNMGEESLRGNSGSLNWGMSKNELIDYSNYIEEVDPYGHAITVHTHINDPESYNKLLGSGTIDATSIQGEGSNYYDWTKSLRGKSASHGKKWVVYGDEQNPAVDDNLDNLDELRKDALWGNLMAGGAGVDWYFGYQGTFGDVQTEDFSVLGPLWDQTRIARNFFIDNLPYWKMSSCDAILSSGDYCFGLHGNVYVLYGKQNDGLSANIPSGEYEVKWFNPRDGSYSEGEINELGGNSNFGNSPFGGDSVLLLNNVDWTHPRDIVFETEEEEIFDEAECSSEGGVWTGTRCCMNDVTYSDPGEGNNCCYEGEIVEDNEVGIPNGDTRFICSDGQFYDNDWEENNVENPPEWALWSEDVGSCEVVDGLVAQKSGGWSNDVGDCVDEISLDDCSKCGEGIFSFCTQSRCEDQGNSCVYSPNSVIGGSCKSCEAVSCSDYSDRNSCEEDLCGLDCGWDIAGETCKPSSEISLCQDVYCGANSYCNEATGSCTCFEGFNNCDQDYENGCEIPEDLSCLSCSEGETIECETSSGCGGVRTCEDGNFGSCKTNIVCSPGEVKYENYNFSGTVCNSLQKEMVCNSCGTGFVESNSSVECCPGQEEQCVSDSGINGTKTCNDEGVFGSCVVDECVEGETRECAPTLNGVQCEENIGIRTCSNGEYGDCVTDESQCPSVSETSQDETGEDTSEVPECISNDDCGSEEVCESGSCEVISCPDGRIVNHACVQGFGSNPVGSSSSEATILENNTFIYTALILVVIILSLILFFATVGSGLKNKIIRKIKGMFSKKPVPNPNRQTKMPRKTMKKPIKRPVKKFPRKGASFGRRY